VSASPSTSYKVVLPDLGESVTEGQIAAWRKGEGDTVEAGETLVDVTTDKVDVEVPAPASGRVLRIVAQEGDTVEVGALLAELVPVDGEGNGGQPAPAAPAAEAPEEDDGGGEVTAEFAAPPREEAAEPEPEPQAAEPEPAPGPGPAPAAGAETVAIVLGDMESVTEGTIVEWRVAEGDAVEQGDIVVEVSTDKVDLEVPAPATGTLARIAVQAGETFSVTDSLGEIAVGGAAPAAAPAAQPEVPAPEPAAEGAPRPAADGGGLASPVARRLAGERGLDLGGVAGTGPGGLVRKRDVLAALEGAAAPAGAETAAPPAHEAPPATEAEPERAVALRGPPAALAAYMDESLTIPTATSVRTINVAELDRRRRQLNEALAAAGTGIKLSYTHLVAWAIVRALERWPVMGTAFARENGTPQRIERSTVNLGLAVDVERKDGSRSLMVPVVRSAERLGFRGFVDAYQDIVGRTRAGQIKPDELRGASVSLTNPGGLGTVASVPRLMAGQGTIVATGAIAYPPGFEHADPARLRDLGVEKVMTMTSTYDHRVIQGAESGAFLGEIDGFLQGGDDFYAQVAESLGVTLDGAAPAAEAPAPAEARAPAAVPEHVDADLLGGVAAATSIVKAHRTHGHLAARLDPLGSEPPGDPALNPESVGLTPELMERVPAQLMRVYVEGDTFAEVLPRLRETYCGTIAYEIEHIGSHQQRVWLREQIESGAMRTPMPPLSRLALLEQLIEVDVFEVFLRRTYLGQKTFSIEGVDVLIPMLTETMELCADAGCREMVLGMAHRGRLATIAQVVGRPAQSILAEFEGHMEFETRDEEHSESAGDVKYHLGAEGTYVTRDGQPVTVNLAANPSHLEQVNAVAEGRTRARQTIRKGSVPRLDHSVAVPVLVHGDAAFPGQGVVAETLNLSALDGYTTGGTIHIIANNQVGFTTDPNESRSTRYASDLAKGFDIPIIHVNADDVEACISAVRLAVAFRRRFGRDVLIDLIGYRRLGHNELDEPAYTQPVMSRVIKEHPQVRKLYAKRLVEERVVSEEHVAEIVANAESRMKSAHAAVTGHMERGGGGDAQTGQRSRSKPVGTAVSAERLTSLNEQLLAVPEGFAVHPKLVPQLDRRRSALGPEGGISWAHAESLAIASLLTEGIPVRLTGQDAARGTFSQRHLELHDVGTKETYKPRTGRVHTPMAHLLRASATFELHNSPLSEAAAVGFEYGYSTQAPEALVLWEAQYGDFANGAQIMIDQFLASGRAKWAQASRLTLLLPHGYEGNGPEHSSARVERFLQLCAEGNMRVADCSTAAQYFHLLRKQALSDEIRPLVVFTPKSLLRARQAASRLEDLTAGKFRPVLDDPRAAGSRDRIRRLILCTGKVFYELDGNAERGRAEDLAIARLELLYPFPEDDVAELIASYPSLTSVTWVQEEPRNMGAWDAVGRRLARLVPESSELGYVGRPSRASPSEGYPQPHQAEQGRILADALGVPPRAPGDDAPAKG
jgi:2-oxoglutarate dehydrogenase E1 component